MAHFNTGKRNAAIDTEPLQVFQVKLMQRQIRAMDKICQESGQKRAQFVRMAIDAKLGANK